MSTRTSDPAVIEHRLLDLAYTTDSVITPSLLAYYAPCSIADAEKVLDTLVAQDRLRLEVDDSGNVRYDMPNRVRIESPRTPALVRQVQTAPAVVAQPNAAVAGVLSLIVPGAGQLYAGHPLSAVLWFLVVSVGYLLLIVPGVILHAVCIAQAASAAHHPRPQYI
jgi:TM2 domain-containing membrane protein YozV